MNDQFVCTNLRRCWACLWCVPALRVRVLSPERWKRTRPRPCRRTRTGPLRTRPASSSSHPGPCNRTPNLTLFMCWPMRMAFVLVSLPVVAHKVLQSPAFSHILNAWCLALPNYTSCRNTTHARNTAAVQAPHPAGMILDTTRQWHVGLPRSACQTGFCWRWWHYTVVPTV